MSEAHAPVEKASAAVPHAVAPEKPVEKPIDYHAPVVYNFFDRVHAFIPNARLNDAGEPLLNEDPAWEHVARPNNVGGHDKSDIIATVLAGEVHDREHLRKLIEDDEQVHVNWKKDVSPFVQRLITNFRLASSGVKIDKRWHEIFNMVPTLHDRYEQILNPQIPVRPEPSQSEPADHPPGHPPQPTADSGHPPTATTSTNPRYHIGDMPAATSVRIIQGDNNRVIVRTRRRKKNAQPGPSTPDSTGLPPATTPPPSSPTASRSPFGPNVLKVGVSRGPGRRGNFTRSEVDYIIRKKFFDPDAPQTPPSDGSPQPPGPQSPSGGPRGPIPGGYYRGEPSPTEQRRRGRRMLDLPGPLELQPSSRTPIPPIYPEPGRAPILFERINGLPGVPQATTSVPGTASAPGAPRVRMRPLGFSEIASGFPFPGMHALRGIRLPSVRVPVAQSAVPAHEIPATVAQGMSTVPPAPVANTHTPQHEHVDLLLNMMLHPTFYTQEAGELIGSELDRDASIPEEWKANQRTHPIPDGQGGFLDNRYPTLQGKFSDNPLDLEGVPAYVRLNRDLREMHPVHPARAPVAWAVLRGMLRHFGEQNPPGFSEREAVLNILDEEAQARRFRFPYAAEPGKRPAGAVFHDYHRSLDHLSYAFGPDAPFDTPENAMHVHNRLLDHLRQRLGPAPADYSSRPLEGQQIPSVPLATTAAPGVPLAANRPPEATLLGKLRQALIHPEIWDVREARVRVGQEMDRDDALLEQLTAHGIDNFRPNETVFQEIFAENPRDIPGVHTNFSNMIQLYSDAAHAPAQNELRSRLGSVFLRGIARHVGDLGESHQQAMLSAVNQALGAPRRIELKRVGQISLADEFHAAVDKLVPRARGPDALPPEQLKAAQHALLDYVTSQLRPNPGTPERSMAELEAIRQLGTQAGLSPVRTPPTGGRINPPEPSNPGFQKRPFPKIPRPDDDSL